MTSDVLNLADAKIEARERDWKAKLEEKRRQEKERGDYSDSSSDVDDPTDDSRRPRLAIDQPPPPTKGIQGDPRAYIAQQQLQQREGVPITGGAPGQPSGPPLQASLPMRPPPLQQGMSVPDIRVDSSADVGNYSTAV